MTIPDDRKYTPTHQWVRVDADGTAMVGITDYAQEQLGDVVFVQHPVVGRKVKQGEACAVVESVKAASDIPAPVSGAIIAVNTALADTPQALNEEPYAAWLFRIRPSDAGELATLLDPPAYRKSVMSDG